MKNLTLKFNKFLQGQSEIIRNVEQRRSNLTGTQLSNKRTHNEFMYTSVPNNEEDDVIDINLSMSTQSTMQLTNNKNQYFQDRNSAVQGIEKMMGELSTMFTRLSHIVYEQRSMIEK